jgi:hypothetical protein
MMGRMAKSSGLPSVGKLFLGDNFPLMARNQVRNVSERRIMIVSFIREVAQSTR